ncbi:MAG: hypothetical protein IJ685_13910 [Selenomonadaceae bacterium]|nr:hypothetical protein [Selenomonadaceae bacterium]
MISILQERTLTIDQRLIVLGFFLDRFDEIFFDTDAEDAMTKLIDAYESKQFLSEQVPRMLATVQFDAKKFIGRILLILENLYRNGVPDYSKKSLNALVETLKIFPDTSGKFPSRNSSPITNHFPTNEKIFWRGTQTFWKIFWSTNFS